jgi:predicted dehydrogenase
MNTRRSFVKALSLAGASSFLTARSYLRAQGSNDTIRVAGIGVGGRGPGIFKDALETKQARIVALCDVDEKRAVAGKENFEKNPLNGNAGIQVFTDIRRLVESKEIDAVMIATPNHWHTLAAIWAMQAGLDVYVEKPVSHTLWEGRQLVAAADKYKRVVQSGTQSRSSGGLIAAHQWLQNAPLGKLRYARGTCYKRRASIGKVTAVQPVPEGLNYDLWCGPARNLPVHRQKLHYDWHWLWEYGNGDLGNQGVHQVDIARWFLGEEELPPEVLSIGGRLGYQDDGETPNTQILAFDYAKAPLYFEVRGLTKSADSKDMDTYRKSQVGVVLQYENGHVLIPSYTGAIAFDAAGKPVHVFGNVKLDPADESVLRTEGGKQTHAQNFFNAVRSRDASKVSCPARQGHVSAALCHLAGISHRLGKNVSPDALRSTVKDHADFADSLGRMLEHLQANLVDLSATPLTLGQKLFIDPKKQECVKNPAANALLHRKDRKGFEIPRLTA